jgi:hypothetical protein
MNTLMNNSFMTQQLNPKQLWIGAVEVRPLQQNSDVLGDTKGAFVNIVTWACDAEEYEQNAELVVGKLGLFVGEVVNPEPVETRRKREGRFTEEVEDIISRAQDNPNAIIYGTFHTFEKDNA